MEYLLAEGKGIPRRSGSGSCGNNSYIYGVLHVSCSLGGTLHYFISFNPHNNNFQESTIIAISQMRIMKSERLGDLSNVTQLEKGRASQG